MVSNRPDTVINGYKFQLMSSIRLFICSYVHPENVRLTYYKYSPTCKLNRFSDLYETMMLY